MAHVKKRLDHLENPKSLRRVSRMGSVTFEVDNPMNDNAMNDKFTTRRRTSSIPPAPAKNIGTQVANQAPHTHRTHSLLSVFALSSL